MPASELASAQDDLQQLFASRELADIALQFARYAGDQPWLQQGIANFHKGCPATAALIIEQLQRGAF